MDIAMSIKEKLFSDLKTAMKARDAIKVSTIRMVNSALKNKEIEKGNELADTEVETIIASEMKKRREAAEQYAKGGREELAEKEKAEMAILIEYLPEQMSEDDVRKLVREAIEEAGATAMSDLGKVMKGVMPKLKGKADGSVVNRIAKEELTG